MLVIVFGTTNKMPVVPDINYFKPLFFNSASGFGLAPLKL